jgi:hypothetical protein
MRPKLTLKRLKIKGNFTKTFNETLDIEIRNAARAWLKIVMTHVPVWTGMAAGSLIPLGQYLRIAIPIHRNPSADTHGYQWRSEAQGIPLGHFRFEHRKTSVTFWFSTDVAHYNINELFDPRPDIHLIHDAPWHSWEHGRVAFFDYLHKNLPQKLPKLKNYIETSELHV